MPGCVLEFLFTKGNNLTNRIFLTNSIVSMAFDVIALTTAFLVVYYNGELSDALPNKCKNRGGRIECGYERENWRRNAEFAGIRRPPVYDSSGVGKNKKFRLQVNNDYDSSNPIKPLKEYNNDDYIYTIEQDKLLVTDGRLKTDGKIKLPKLVKTTNSSSCVDIMRKILGNFNKVLPSC